ncbi:MAG: hypothetical protein HY047_16660, partial [Acidobacteria bacterium]|nr:hypothetical protein [Acidobacteriota bacterium]
AITACVLDALGREGAGAPPPAALTFLLRRYVATDRDDLRDALGEALAPAFERAEAETDGLERAAWLTLFVEASAISDDDRLPAAAASLIVASRRAWPSATIVEPAMASVDACLRAANIGDAQELVSAAIDELERIVGHAYQPGDGMAHTIHASARVRGELGDQVRSASALITAFEVTGRLPYSMLAEELMQTARRDAADDAAFVARCEAARVFCRLAALHADEAYRGAAVIAPGVNYRADAARLVTALSSDARTYGVGAASYGLALMGLR